MERGRSDFVRLLGVGHEALARGDYGGEGLAFAVRRITIDYLKPGKIDDLLVVETRVAKVGGASATLAQAVKRGEEALAKAEVTIVLVALSGELRRFPRDLRAALSLPPE
jgi:acyl-CoA thioester hydrolase